MTQWLPAEGNQSRYVLAELAGIGTYMIPLGHLVEHPFRQSAFLDAANEMIARHDALRTRFRIVDGGVEATVSPQPSFQYHLITPTDDSLEAFRKLAVPLIFDQVDPTKDGSLVRVIVADYGGKWRFTIGAHHAISDGFSRGMMNKELLKIYAGEDLTPARSFYEFSKPAHLNDDLSPTGRAFIDDLPTPTRLIGDGKGQGSTDDQWQMVDHVMGDVGGSVRKLCKSIGTTKFGLFAAIYALGAYGFSGSTAVSSFFQTEGRKALGAPNSVVGPFSHTLPLNLKIDLDRALASFACDVSQNAKHSISLEHDPKLLNTVLSERKGPSISINMFPPASPIRAGDLVVGAREFLDRRTEFDLNLVWAEERNILSARAFYDQSHMSRERVTLFLDQQERLLRAVLDDPHLSCRDILAKARQSHPAALAQSSLDPTPTQRMHQAFFDRADSTPNAVAIRTSTEDISYQQLAQDARRVAASLQAEKIKPTDTVVIYAARDPALVAAMLGVSATGAAFALVDASYPFSRCEQIIQELDARFVVEGGEAVPDAVADLTKAVPLTAAPSTAKIIDGPPRPEACHMFTSGTTGRPKRITHPDTTLLRFIGWQSKTLDLDKPINTMLMSGLAHDPTLRDIFLPLSHGGMVTIPSPCELLDPKALRALFETSDCNVIRLSASTAQLLTVKAPDDLTFDKLSAIFWGGERLPQIVAQNWISIAPNARQFHVFGTTETPQAFLIHEISETSFETREVPLGHPLPWTGVRLVDPDNNTVAVGEVGEIVAELADPILGVNQKHVSQTTTSACQHFTGDMGYQLADGSVCFIGRRDNQIKINGFRIELKEIEIAIEQMDNRPQAQVVFESDRLIAFVKGDPEILKSADIKSAVARRLPSYMIPTQFLIIPTFPMTLNGKIDHPTLIAMAQKDWASPKDQKIKSQPVGADEKTIAAIFAKATGRPATYRDATLADLGADSLSTIETRLALEEKGFKLPDQWEWMSVQSLALCHSETKGAGTPLKIGLPLQHVDTFIVLRSIAIAMVIIHHSGFDFNVGASLMLIALAGFSFGRVNLPAILKDGRTGRIWALMLKLLVPLIPASLILYFVHQYIGNDPHIATILLYTNFADFIDIAILQKTDRQHLVIWLWFLHSYLQIFLLIGLVLGFPSIRNATFKSPWRAGLIAFGGAACVSVITVLAATLILGGGDFARMAALLQFSPTTILPFFLIGLLFSLAKSQKHIAVTIGIALAYFGLLQILYQNHAEWGWIFALLLCTFVPYAPLPKLGKSVVMLLSVNALMIYLSHRIVYFILDKVSPFDIPFALLVAAQLAIGVILGIALRPVIDALGINRLSNKRISF